MKEADARKRVEDLRTEVRRHDYRYYVLAEPLVSDEAYDRLMRELESLERQFPGLVTPDSPTRRVAETISEGFEVVSHAVPMLSIQNAYEEGEVREFEARVEKILGRGGVSYAIEPKVDGVAVSVLYRSGRLVRGATRGDGLRGDDVTANLRTLRSLPMRLLDSGPAPESLEVRGEVFIGKAAFEKMNEEMREKGDRVFANPRNAAAGSLKLLDPRLVAERPLDLVVHSVVEGEGLGARTHSEALRRVRDLGLPIVDPVIVVRGAEGILAVCREWDGRRRELLYQVDGVVIKVDDLAAMRELGHTSKNPRGILAFKFHALEAVTVVREILPQVGRTGVVTPVAVLEPVFLAGTTVSRATLHNEEEVRRKDIRVGDTVVVEKGGEVIPKVVKVIEDQRTGAEVPFRMPERCPSCGQPLRHFEDEVAVRCTNIRCPAQVQRRIEHFAGRNAMDIEGLGEVLVENLVRLGWVVDPGDLYALEAEKVAGIERMGEKSAQNLLDALGASKGRGLARLVFGLGIRHVGARAARVLAEHFGSMDALSKAAEEELASLDEIGPVIAASVVDFFSQASTRAVLGKLRAAGVRMEEAASRRGHALEGLRFVVTGALPGRSRSEVEARIRSEGGQVSGSVSRKTDYLLAGEDPGSKLERARELKVPVLDAAGFEALLRKGSTSGQAG